MDRVLIVVIVVGVVNCEVFPLASVKAMYRVNFSLNLTWRGGPSPPYIRGCVNFIVRLTNSLCGGVPPPIAHRRPYA